VPPDSGANSTPPFFARCAPPYRPRKKSHALLQCVVWSIRHSLSIAWFFVAVLSLDASGHHVEICCDLNVMGFCCDRHSPGFETRPYTSGPCRAMSDAINLNHKKPATSSILRRR
jgi:hypothetical protein